MLRWVALATLLMACVSTSGAVAEGGGVLGTVTDAEGRQLEDVSIAVEGPQGALETKTDESGRFRFLKLRPGNYRLKVHFEGFSEPKYSALTVRLGRLTTVKVQLAAAIEEILIVATERPSVSGPATAPGGAGSLDGAELDRIGHLRDPFRSIPGVTGGSEGAARGDAARSEAEDDSSDSSLATRAGRAASKRPANLDLKPRRASAGSARTSGNNFFSSAPSGVGPIRLVTSRPGASRRADADLQLADRSWQSSSSRVDGFDVVDGDSPPGLAAGRVESVTAWGLDGAAGLWGDRLWMWGGFQHRDSSGTALGGAAQSERLQHGALKLNGQLGRSSSVVVSGQRTERRHAGVGAAPDRGEGSTQVDSSPSRWLALEGTHLFTSAGGDLQVSARAFSARNAISLVPEGGGGDILLDSGGVWRGGWLERHSEIDGEGAQAELSWAFDVPRGQHEVTAGWQQRETERRQQERWGEGNVVFLAGENYGTPFDLVRLHRSGDLNLGREATALWVQDSVTLSGVGEWSFNIGLRYDYQSGETLGGSAASNPLLPELLPQITDPGGRAADFKDLLPRLSAAWTPGDRRKTTVHMGVSRFASRLQDSLLERVSPLAGSEIVLGFNDVDRNRRFDGSEPFIVLDRLGESFFEGFSSDRDLESELTDELRLGLSFQPAYATEVRVDWVRRETSRIFDSLRLVSDGGTVRVAQVNDYRLDTLYSGLLPDGTPYTAPVYTLRDGLQFTGGSLIRNGDREQTYESVRVGFTRRLTRGFMLRASATWNDWRWRVGGVYSAFDDPTDTALGDLDGVDNDGAVVARSAADDRWVDGRWSFDVVGVVQVARNRPWGFDLSAHVHGRDGYPIPYSLTVASADRLREVQVTSEADSYRLEDVFTVDLRVEKALSIGALETVLSLDVLNALDEGFILERQTRLSSPVTGSALASLSPRVVQLGVRVAWR
ncbi:MAG: carboxypeptidase regulatory-like domain-containing protein [Acidobacteriota bacterium]